MAEVNTATYKNRYNNGTTGLFKDNITGDIEASDARDLVEYTGDSFLNFLDDVLDEDEMTSNSATQVPTQQSVKAYADTKWPLGGAADLISNVTIGGGNFQIRLGDADTSDYLDVLQVSTIGSVLLACYDIGVGQGQINLFPSSSEISWESDDSSIYNRFFTDSSGISLMTDDGVDSSSFSLTPTGASFDCPVGVGSYTVATLPSATGAARFIYVSDESGGPIPAFSDGTNWRRFTDGSIVS